MSIEQLPIFCYYDKQRFTQFGSMDCANWYGVQSEGGKAKQALYPAMGRAHVNFQGVNKLIFNGPPRVIFKTINYFYVVVGNEVYQVDQFYNVKPIGTVSLTGDVWFAYLTVQTTVYAMITDGTNIYVITENGTAVTYQVVTDANAPKNPQFVAAFGNRFVVNVGNTPQYFLTDINVGGTFDPATVFTIPPTMAGTALFNSASGIVRQFAVLHNQLYIFTDFTADIWANIPTYMTVAGATTEFPWKLNTSYNWDYGIADPFSLSTDFGRMCWLAKNRDGLITFMTSNGGQPTPIQSQAVAVLLQGSIGVNQTSPFLTMTTDGFLYQYENTIFYRVSAGTTSDFGKEPLSDEANAIEYNFNTGKWERVIELDGTRNLILKHVYFNNLHLVTVFGDPAIYQMAGNIYYNELRTPNTLPTDINAFTQYPMRYELTTQQIFQEDYSEFADTYVEIDFVFGDADFYYSNAPFNNTVYIITEDSTPTVPVYVTTEDSTTASPIFVIAEGSDTPTFTDNHYNALFKPYIELSYSDDGGVSFTSADVREFSQLGQYRWRMRWYELATSRNRCYKLQCVSSAPVVILGGVRNTQRVSGGAN